MVKEYKKIILTDDTKIEDYFNFKEMLLLKHIVEDHFYNKNMIENVLGTKEAFDFVGKIDILLKKKSIMEYRKTTESAMQEVYLKYHQDEIIDKPIREEEAE